MSKNNVNNTLNIYPVEQAFKASFIITALFVLIPALAIYWFFGDASSFPRSLKLFFGNWISPIILWFFVASFLHLLLKRKKLKKEVQQTSTIAQQFLSSFGAFNESKERLGEEGLLESARNIAKQSNIAQNNLLLSRFTLFTSHSDNDIDETFGLKEREQMKGSFSLPRFMVWAIPIMGFIGTVWGISNGIAHFSDAMTSTSSVTDVSAMLKENLPLVTNSLATAFDTTLLALLLSIPLMMVMLTLEKSEEAYLIELDERWYHDIKPLLDNGSVGSKGQNATGIGSSAVVSASNSDSALVAGEIKMLSTQIKALQETMEDLYESVFTSKLNDKK